MVFTLPAPIADIAYTNKAVIYGLLFDVAAEVLQTSAADPKHLGARIGATLVLHTWGSALTHHPHVHGIVPGGGLSGDGKQWIACRPGFFLPVRVLSGLFRRRFLEDLQQLHQAGRLQFFSEHLALLNAFPRYDPVTLNDADFDTALAVFNTQSGSVTTGTWRWAYATGLAGTAGTTGTNGSNPFVVLDNSGNALSASPVPEPAGVTLGVFAAAGILLRRSRGSR